MRGLAIQIDRKVLCSFAGDGGFALTIVGQAEKRQDGEGKTHADVGHNFAKQSFHIPL